MIDAFMVCINYSDFLKMTLPSNRKHFNRVVVVTSALDNETKRICDANNTEWINFDLVPYKNQFLLGRGLNYGYSVLDSKDWVCKLDADILLPHNFNELASQRAVDKDILYGCRRKCLTDKSKYNKWIRKGQSFNSIKKPLNMNKIAQGFLQLFHVSSKNTTMPLYGVKPGAGKIDIIFRNKFSIVEYLGIDVIHIGPSNTNWNGRKSESWDSEAVTFYEDALTEDI